jgi:hypothetical protein
VHESRRFWGVAAGGSTLHLLRAAVACFLAILGGSALAAQPPDATVILSEEERVALELEQGLASCQVLDGIERTVCLANLSLSTLNAEPCAADPTGECSAAASRAAMGGCRAASSEAEVAACELRVAAVYADPASCAEASAAVACLSVVASERKDPSILTAAIEDPRTRGIAIGAYALSTGDVSALDPIEDNYLADTLHIAARVTAAGRSGEQLSDAFCWTGLRGNYQERDSYTEDFDGTQVLCVAVVHQVNAWNAALQTTEKPEERDEVVRQIRAMLERIESEADSATAGDSGGDWIREAAGLPTASEAESEVAEARGAAEQFERSCDYVASLASAESLRARTEGLNAERAALAEQEGRTFVPVREPWLAANYDAVVSGAARQREFRTLFEAAQDVLDGWDERTEGDLDTARSLAELARGKAATGPGCQEAYKVDALLATIDNAREVLREVIAERRAAERDGEGEVADDEWQGGFLDTREVASVGSGEEVLAGWGEGSRTDEVDSCRASRPEYEGALYRVQAALRQRARELLLAELSSGLLTPRCPGDRERLEALRGTAIGLDQADAAAKASHMRAAMHGARQAEAQREQAWASAAVSFEQILGEYQRAAAAAAAPLQGGGSDPAGGAPDAGSPAAATAGSGASPPCLVDPQVSRASGEVTYWVEERSAATGGLAIAGFKILGLPGRPPSGGSSRYHGPFADLTAAQAALDRLCPPAQRSTGGIRFQ